MVIHLLVLRICKSRSVVWLASVVSVNRAHVITFISENHIDAKIIMFRFRKTFGWTLTHRVWTAARTLCQYCEGRTSSLRALQFFGRCGYASLSSLLQTWPHVFRKHGAPKSRYGENEQKVRRNIEWCWVVKEVMNDQRVNSSEKERCGSRSKCLNNVGCNIAHTKVESSSNERYPDPSMFARLKVNSSSWSWSSVQWLYKVAKKSTKSIFSSAPNVLSAPMGNGPSSMSAATRNSRFEQTSEATSIPFWGKALNLRKKKRSTSKRGWKNHALLPCTQHRHFKIFIHKRNQKPCYISCVETFTILCYYMYNPTIVVSYLSRLHSSDGRDWDGKFF